MRTVYKYRLNPNVLLYSMPLGAELLFVHEQNDCIFVWVEVNPDEARMEMRKILVLGTGFDIPDEPLKYFGTVLLDKGALVFHVYIGV